MKIKDFKKYVFQTYWSIGFLSNYRDVVLYGKKAKIRAIKNLNRESWYADPFILSMSDTEIKILVEDYTNGKGRISCLTIDKKTNSIVTVEPIIELSTHLSFPAFYRENGKAYIYPESNKSGKLLLYEYNERTGECKEVNVLVGEPLTDATIWNDYLLTTKMPDPNGKHLFIYRNTQGKYYLNDTIVFNDNIARNAGEPFEIDGILYRPTQICNSLYGEGMTFQIMKLINGKFSFEEKQRVYAKFPYIGFHTFNKYGDLVIIDRLRYRFIIADLIMRVWRYIKCKF